MKNVRQKDFRKTEKNLIYFAAKSTILSIKTPLAEVKICRIIFGSDGSIYVPFPYLNNKQGILSKIEIEPTAREPITYDLIKGGVEVSYDVKFTHHKSGIVQFSRTGTNENLPRHNSFPLDNQIGHIFNLFVYWLSGFNWIDKRSNNDLLLTFGFKEHPLAVCIRSEWRRKNDIMSNMTTPGGFVGPTTIAINKKTGSKKSFFLLGQPDGFPLQDNVLLISAEQNSLPEGANNPSMVFLGGFDEHEITAIRPNPKIKGALAFLYPLR